jgi:hypothetical protein
MELRIEHGITRLPIGRFANCLLEGFFHSHFLSPLTNPQDRRQSFCFFHYLHKTFQQVSVFCSVLQCLHLYCHTNTIDSSFIVEHHGLPELALQPISLRTVNLLGNASLVNQPQAMATPEDPIVIFHGGDVTLLCGEANYSPTPSPFCSQPTGPTPASLTPASQTPANSVRASQTPARSNRASPNPTSSIPVSPHHTSSDEPTVPTSSLGLDQILGGKSPSINEPTSSQYPNQTTGDSLVSSEIPRGRSLVVASRVLSLNSRPFKATLKPGFQTGVQFAEDGKITVRMAEDSGKAMTVICNIIHGCDAWIPTKASTSRLHEIAVLSDKYDFNQALEPAVTTWVRDYVSDLGENPTRQSRIDTWMNVLFSAYLFRHQQLAHKAMEGLVLCSYLTKRGLDTKRYRIPDRLLRKS